MQSRLSASHLPLQLKNVVAASGSAPSSSQPAFEGTISSACGLGIGIEDFIAMTRIASTSDPRAARFLDAWDALGTCEQQSVGTADAVCEQIGLAPLDLLKTVADAAFRFSMYTAQIIAAAALPSVVECCAKAALTEEGIADRKMLFQHTGFLPTLAGSQTNISIMQNAQLNAAAQPVITAAPRPDETIRRLCDRLNEAKTSGDEKDDGN
jgi:hypothetical protein